MSRSDLISNNDTRVILILIDSLQGAPAIWNILGDGPLEWSEDADATQYACIDGPLAWQQHALCARTDPEAFSPEKGGPTRDVEAVYQARQVYEECLEYALANDEHFGIWSDISERERRRLRRMTG